MFGRLVWLPPEGKKYEMAAFKKRLKREFEEVNLRPPAGISLDMETVEDNLNL